MAFPPPTIQTNVTDATDQAGLHPDLHNKLAAGVNDITTEVIRVNSEVVRVSTGLDSVAAYAQEVNGKVDAVAVRVTTVEGTVASLSDDAKRLGAIRGRTNIDTITNTGSVRYTVPIFNDGVTDTGDGSGYLVPAGVYGVNASTVSDGTGDLTCYIQIGTRPVQVGVGIGGPATYATWVGSVAANEQISVHVSMPTPCAVVDGRLEIWRLAEST